MDSYSVKTPVAFMIFNRPDTTRRVFERIKEAKPERLLIVADGARSSVPGEEEKCEECRSIIKEIDWKCDVSTNLAEVNLGCKNRISSGITWVFDQVEEAIIIEDDCLPDRSFFRFCDEMIEKYKNDQRIMMVAGINHGEVYNTESSYCFSSSFRIWGWATWKRAWEKYDLEMKEWEKCRNSRFLGNIFFNEYKMQYYARVLQRVFEGDINTWDYQWYFCGKVNHGLCIIPSVNLVENIGFGIDATHTSNSSEEPNYKCEEMKFPLIHPSIIAVSDNNIHIKSTIIEKLKVFKWKYLDKKDYIDESGYHF